MKRSPLHNPFSAHESDDLIKSFVKFGYRHFHHFIKNIIVMSIGLFEKREKKEDNLS